MRILETFESPHTHQQLQRLEASFSVLGDIEASRVRDAITGREPIGIDPDTGRRFRVVSSSYSYHDSSSTNFVVELQETELLEPISLDIGGIPVVPTRYSEEPAQGGIVVNALVAVSDDVAERLEDLIVDGPLYFEVVREGVEEGARSMRFGQCLWSTEEEGRAYLLVLVEEGVDHATGRGPGLFQPTLARIEEAVAELSGLVRTMGDRLVAADVFESSDWASILAAVSDPSSVNRERRRFQEADDVERHWMD